MFGAAGRQATEKALALCAESLEEYAARVYAEDPANNDLPQAGQMLLYREPSMPGIRIDSGAYEGGEVSVYYDPLIAKLIADGEWMLDPLNPNRNDNGVGGQNSFLAGPDYRPNTYAAGSNDLRGRLENLELPGGDTRKVQVYLPPGYARGAARYPVLYAQDGTESIKLGRAAEVADRMITEGKVAPFIIVFVDPVDRMKDYWASDRFADWMARTLVPLVDGRYRTRATREARALSGASLGGVISVWTALRHPATFSRVGGFSTAFQIDEERLLASLARLDATARRRFSLRFYLDAGRYEPPIFETTRRANLLLTSRRFPFTRGMAIES